MFALMLLATQVVIPGSAITPDQVSTTPPAELGEKLLGPTRLPIVEAYIAGEALEPPPPPGGPIVTKVWLYEQARESTEPGFCRKVRYQVRLAPVHLGADGKLPPASADTVTPSTLYRWKTTDGRGPTCEGHGSNFFSVSDSDAAGVFAFVRELAAAQSELQQHKPVRFTGSIDDTYGRQGYPVPGASGPITDWKIALSDFPLSQINRYYFERSEGAAKITFRAAEWTVEITIANGGGLSNLAFRRFIPSPA
jgi:hypothetical protein